MEINTGSDEGAVYLIIMSDDFDDCDDFANCFQNHSADPDVLFGTDICICSNFDALCWSSIGNTLVLRAQYYDWFCNACYVGQGDSDHVAVKLPMGSQHMNKKEYKFERYPSLQLVPFSLFLKTNTECSSLHPYNRTVQFIIQSKNTGLVMANKPIRCLASLSHCTSSHMIVKRIIPPSHTSKAKPCKV